MNTKAKPAKRPAKPATKRAAHAKPAQAAKAKGNAPQTKGAARSRIDVHTDAVRKACSAEAGTSVDALRDALGICRKSVRKLLAEVKATRGDDGKYHA